MLKRTGQVSRLSVITAGLYYWICVHQSDRGKAPKGTFTYMASAAPIGTGWSSRWEDGPPKPFMPMPVRCHSSTCGAVLRNKHFSVDQAVVVPCHRPCVQEIFETLRAPLFAAVHLGCRGHEPPQCVLQVHRRRV